MILTTLGGSAAGPNPGQGCSGYLVESGSTRIVLDLGPGTLPELRRHSDFRRLDAVILSHLHLDHVLDVLTLRFALAYNPVAAPVPIPLWVPPGGESYFNGLAAAIGGTSKTIEFLSVFEINEFDPDLELAIGNLRVSFHPTVHYIPCWAMRVSNGIDGDLFYTADTGPTAQLVPFARGARVLISEGTLQEGSTEPLSTRGHLTPAEAGALANEAGAETLVLTHLWAENDAFAAIGAAESAFSGTVYLATPGLRLTWSADVIEPSQSQC